MCNNIIRLALNCPVLNAGVAERDGDDFTYWYHRNFAKAVAAAFGVRLGDEFDAIAANADQQAGKAASAVCVDCDQVVDVIAERIKYATSIVAWLT